MRFGLQAGKPLVNNCTGVPQGVRNAALFAVAWGGECEQECKFIKNDMK